MHIDLYGNPSQSYRASLAIWDHTVLPATRHKWTRPAITPASQAGTRFTYPGGMEGWVDLGSLIAARPGIEPTTAWSQVRRPNQQRTPPTDKLTKILRQICHTAMSEPAVFVAGVRVVEFGSYATNPLICGTFATMLVAWVQMWILLLLEH